MGAEGWQRSRRVLRVVPAVLLAGVVPALPASASTPVTVPRVVAADLSFFPSSVAISRGGSLVFTNLDTAPHNVTSLVSRRGRLLFSSVTAGTGATVVVSGTAHLRPGFYAFLCTVHPQMRGELQVQP